jgi:glycosyltransferase involved in cell wall biosynthesis
MKNPILSICIPTYNRAHYLENALDSILCQLQEDPELSSLVEVVVSDNASPDNTKALVERYQPLIPLLTYSRNAENVGPDRNVLRAVECATGIYGWYLGDDDTIVNGALRAIVEICRDQTFDIGGVNIEELTETSDWRKHRVYTPDDIIKTTDPNEYYLKGYCRGVLSALIFRREPWLQVVRREDIIETCLYYETVLAVLGRSNRQFFVQKPMIMAGSECRWAENGGELLTYINFNLTHRRMLEYGFDVERTETELRRSERQLILFLLRAKGRGLPLTFKNLLFIWKNVRQAGLARLVLSSLIFFIPNPVIRFIRDSRKYLKLRATLTADNSK